ncbi:cupin domain-containing protein [Nocardia vaccinii]|uniref:cupin domain-containing protein n=1 Tax=Nocardia vaccinii TaxID=1822 RepID=UPI00082DF80D|nr:cupin domain-containing protein [Nocardia vaccinii]
MTAAATPIAVDTAAWHPRDGAAPNAQRLLSGPGLTLVSFSFRQGQILDEHRAPGPILIHCLSGAIELDITTDTGTESHRLEPGTVVHVAARAPHRLAAQLDSVVHVTLHRNVESAG